mmetsp:Transcript_34224/g.77556  ORF Transcript_34224/g.77556 Transcript_34224/m.77556 type:complete len:264 (-) Transcript_34224:16-807(-)
MARHVPSQAGHVTHDSGMWGHLHAQVVARGFANGEIVNPRDTRRHSGCNVQAHIILVQVSPHHAQAALMLRLRTQTEESRRDNSYSGIKSTRSDRLERLVPYSLGSNAGSMFLSRSPIRLSIVHPSAAACSAHSSANVARIRCCCCGVATADTCGAAGPFPFVASVTAADETGPAGPAGPVGAARSAASWDVPPLINARLASSASARIAARSRDSTATNCEHAATKDRGVYCFPIPMTVAPSSRNRVASRVKSASDVTRQKAS